MSIIGAMDTSIHRKPGGVFGSRFCEQIQFACTPTAPLRQPTLIISLRLRMVERSSIAQIVRRFVILITRRRLGLIKLRALATG